MSELTKDNDDAALDWLFSRARKFVLLTAEEERAIDLKKWLALEQLQQLFVADAHCRRYLSAWAENTLNNPPTLDGCEIREHYYLLRREQVGLLEGGEQRLADYYAAREQLVNHNLRLVFSNAGRLTGRPQCY
jgi:hypothetical protein